MIKPTLLAGTPDRMPTVAVSGAGLMDDTGYFAIVYTGQNNTYL